MKVSTLSLTVVIYLAVSTNMADSFRVGAFNIQVFGTKKAQNPEILSVLARILRRYDIILIQEIRDKSGNAVKALLKEVNKYSGKTHKYKMVISDRLGRTSSKEQYAFFYRSAYGIKVVDSYHYDDGDESTGSDTFQREPFIVHFNIPQLVVKDIAMISIHTDPGQAVAETKALSAVVDDVIKRLGVHDVMIMGDLNADCGSFAKKYWKEVSLWTDKERFFWPIDDSVDTTTGATDCAYDRFVLTGPNLISAFIRNSADIYRFDNAYKLDNDQAKAVSDHYPIELRLAVDITYAAPVLEVDRDRVVDRDVGAADRDRVEDRDTTSGCADRFRSFCSSICCAGLVRMVQSINSRTRN